MDAGADAVPVSDRLRAGWRSRRAAPDAGELAGPADDVLVRRVAAGDAAALTALYRRYGDRLFAFLQRYAGDPMVAEEILQDTLLAVWHSAHRYAARSEVRTWLFGIARRQAHNRLRTRQPVHVPLDSVVDRADPGPGPAEWAAARAHGAAVAAGFARLAPAHREILALAFAARMPHREIADLLGVPVGTVKSRLHHARAALAAALADREEW